jgi:hypothetical protein
MPCLANFEWSVGGPNKKIRKVENMTIADIAGARRKNLLLKKLLKPLQVFACEKIRVINGVTTNPEITKNESTPRYPSGK